MDDLISRQAVIEAIDKNACNTQRIFDAVKALPSAQPEIIRCKDCKYASGNSRICLKLGHSPIGELDFCSYAEKREVTT